jgi:hypothetical protein
MRRYHTDAVDCPADMIAACLPLELRSWLDEDLCRPITREHRPSTWRVHDVQPSGRYL